MGAFRHRRPRTGLAYDLLPPDARPAIPPPRHFERRPDVSDAEFVIIGRARTAGFSPGTVNDNRRRTLSKPVASPAATVLSTGVRAAEHWLQQASPRMFAALVVALFVLVFGLSGGFSGLSAAPETVGEAAAPLAFTHVPMSPRDANGMRILLINGIVENEPEATVSLQPFRADLYAGERLITTVVITPPADQLAAHQSRGFSARLQHPGGKTPELRLSFLR